MGRCKARKTDGASIAIGEMRYSFFILARWFVFMSLTIIRAVAFLETGIAKVLGAISTVIEHSLGTGERTSRDNWRGASADFTVH